MLKRTPCSSLAIPAILLIIVTVCAGQDADVLSELHAYLAMERQQRPAFEEQGFAAAALSKTAAHTAREMLWKDYADQVRTERAAETENREITLGDHKMPFSYRILGDTPPDGRSLYISLHGGGGAPKRVNDRQWENQKQLYTPDEGVYLAPRAPTNAWNLWHQPHIDELFDRLITNLIVLENVNPNRVYLMGYSAGGDGVYQLAPRMADRFAAAAMMAGHPNDASPLGLRNIGFTIHVGGRDAAYKRNDVAAEWSQKLAKLKAEDPQGYQHLVKIHAEKGHWMDREDAVAVPWMAEFCRDPWPTRVVWKQDDVTHDRFYWLAVPTGAAQNGTHVVAERNGNTIAIESADVADLLLRCDDRMFDLDKPVTVTWDGDQVFHGRCRRSLRTLAKTLHELGDPEMIFASEIHISLPQTATPTDSDAAS